MMWLWLISGAGAVLFIAFGVALRLRRNAQEHERMMRADRVERYRI